MTARTDLFEVAFATMGEAVSAQGRKQQTLLEDAIRLFHLAQAVEADKVAIAAEPRAFAPQARVY